MRSPLKTIYKTTNNVYDMLRNLRKVAQLVSFEYRNS